MTQPINDRRITTTCFRPTFGSRNDYPAIAVVAEERRIQTSVRLPHSFRFLHRSENSCLIFSWMKPTEEFHKGKFASGLSVCRSAGVPIRGTKRLLDVLVLYEAFRPLYRLTT
ncbi:hypothetical protein L596_005711 [Steinernema carpocapsae]|uniref:Uncharacterized protein n=1 Tax=Steinernema carpocapsae TaxID=34508 RepID=A0A4U8V1H3_STECR|nr:hypothetical protein L596_005711 [Steinernema carpocapsae]